MNDREIAKRIWTIGHSTHELDEFIRLLRMQGLIDEAQERAALDQVGAHHEKTLPSPKRPVPGQPPRPPAGQPPDTPPPGQDEQPVTRPGQLSTPETEPPQPDKLPEASPP